MANLRSLTCEQYRAIVEDVCQKLESNPPMDIDNEAALSAFQHIYFCYGNKRNGEYDNSCADLWGKIRQRVRGKKGTRLHSLVNNWTHNPMLGFPLIAVGVREKGKNTWACK